MSALTKTLLALSIVLLLALVGVSVSFVGAAGVWSADHSRLAQLEAEDARRAAEHDTLLAERKALEAERDGLAQQLATHTQPHPEGTDTAEADGDPARVFDELAAVREQLDSAREQLAAAELLRDRAEHDTTMWRQQVERERRRAGTADATQQDEDIAALSAELIEQAAANTRLTQTLALVTDRLAAQDEQIDGLVKLLSGLAREQDDLATQRQAYAAEERRFTSEVARLEQLYADTEARREALARELAEGFDQTPDEVRALRGRLLEAADRQSELENARAFAEQSEQAARAELVQAIGELSAKDERIEELYRTIADLNENYARILRENYDLGYRLDAVTAERDTLKEQLDQMLQLPGPNLDKSQAR